MIPFLKLSDLRPQTSDLRPTRAETCWLGFAAGCAFTVIVFALVTLFTR
jgi:hypothetical protein